MMRMQMQRHHLEATAASVMLQLTALHTEERGTCQQLEENRMSVSNIAGHLEMRNMKVRDGIAR